MTFPLPTFMIGGGPPAADGVLRSPNTMTSNTAPSPFVASASAEYDANSRAFRAWDGVNADYPSGSWFVVGYAPQWVQIYLGTTSYWMESYSVRTRYNVTDHAPTQWTLQGSTDGSSWTTVDSQTGITSWSLGEKKTYTIATASRRLCNYWRLNITDTLVPGNGVCCVELNLYT